MKQIILEVFNFIKNPKDERIENWTLKKNVNYIFNILIFELLINFLVFIPITYFLNLLEPLISETRIDYKSNTLIYTLFLAGLIVPIAEELIFRYGLRKNKLFSLVISKNVWNKIFRFLVYLSVLTFGFVHISNYENNSILFYCISPIIVSSQLIGGIFLTFLRVKFNLLSAIIAHLLWNSLVIVIPFILIFFEKPYVKQTENYAIKIQYVAYNNKVQKFEIDSSSSKIYKVKINEYSMNHILDTLLQYKRNNEDHLINIDFNSKRGISKENFKDVLLEYDKEELQ